MEKCETPLKGFIKNDYFKLYLSDTGLLSSLLEISYNKIMLDEEFMYKGAITENYVANELVSTNHSLYYWAKNQVAEMDFLIDTEEGIIPIEVKANSNVKSKSLMYYKEKQNPLYSIRISSKNFGFEDGIKSVPLYAVFCI